MQNWKKIEKVLTPYQILNLYSLLIDRYGTISEDRAVNLKLLGGILPYRTVQELYRIKSIGHMAVRKLVGIYYQSNPNCELVTSFFRCDD